MPNNTLKSPALGGIFHYCFGLFVCLLQPSQQTQDLCLLRPDVVHSLPDFCDVLGVDIARCICPSCDLIHILQDLADREVFGAFTCCSFAGILCRVNCIAAMSATVNRKLLSRKTDCKYRYRANVNLMIGYFKYRLSAMLLFAGKALDICRQLISLCLKQPVPMIKGRSAPRPEFSHQRKVFCSKYSI